MPRRPSPRRLAIHRRKRRSLGALAADVARLRRRIDRLEGQRRRIGFVAVSAEGDRIVQDDDEYDYTPDEV